MLKYYSMDSTLCKLRKGVKAPTLKADLERGVKYLSEWSYSSQWGSTSGCLRFMNVLKRYIDITKVNRAVMRYKKNSYTLRLYSPEGYTILLKGVGSGYTGEGSRGCHDILLACGFNESQCNKPFKFEQFEVRK